MLNYVDQDLFQSGAQVLVNPVNLKGVMGAGLALQFKQRFPAMFQQYQKACRDGSISIGNCQWYICSVDERFKHSNLQAIVNFPTKDHWKHPSRLEYIELGLLNLKKKSLEFGMLLDSGITIAMPALGCGLGSLSWVQVKPLVEQVFGNTNLNVTVCLTSNR